MSSPPIEFAPWRTGLENARLQFVDVIFGGQGTSVNLIEDQMRLEVAGHRPVTEQPLEARFFDLDTHIIYRIGCSPVAFRVLDEHGLVELWHAMNEQRRPVGSSTFMVRNHGWSRESELSFMHGTRDGYSYIIATRLECLEIVAIDTPVIEQVGMAEASALSSAKRH